MSRVDPLYYSTPTVKVKRDGGRGWKFINLASFDPTKHVRVDQVEPEKKRKPRTPK